MTVYHEVNNWASIPDVTLTNTTKYLTVINFTLRLSVKTMYMLQIYNKELHVGRVSKLGVVITGPPKDICGCENTSFDAKIVKIGKGC